MVINYMQMVKLYHTVCHGSRPAIAHEQMKYHHGFQILCHCGSPGHDHIMHEVQTAFYIPSLKVTSVCCEAPCILCNTLDAGITFCAVNVQGTFMCNADL